MPDPTAPPLDPDKLKLFAKNIFGALGGAMTSAMIHLGDRLGLYRALAGAGSVTSEELAQKTGLDERWLREWMYQQGAAGVLEHRGEGCFALAPEGAALLAEESHPAFGAGMFGKLPETMSVLEKLPEAFRTGRGLPYDALGPEGARGVERGLGPRFKALLVPVVLPKLPGVVPALEAGAQVADVGCGAGAALLAMAKAFPKSAFHGYDISEHALARAQENRREAGIENAHFHHLRREPLPADGRFAFITTIDCLHDMTDPASVMRAIRAAIRPDTILASVIIKAYDSYEANVAKNPMAPLMYGTSVMSCMSSALSEPGGLGLGTLGLSAKKAQEMTAAAGFTRFEPADVGHPVNAFYRVRP
jgi:2-polyprenyl-3-methyl-5-hydroxy-6-metoxy-1,4-benzoquinol methylase